MSQPGDLAAKTPTDPDASPSDLTDLPGNTVTSAAAAEGEGTESSEAAAGPATELSGTSSANDMLCTSQTLDDEPLTPEVVTPPKAAVPPG